MNREIKFRAYSHYAKKENGSKMVYRDLYAISQQGFGLPIDSSETIIMQFTGLKDRNYKEIYENDIIKSGEKIGVMEWDRKRFQIKSGKIREWENEMGDLWSEREIEVIGNIYETPELLEK